MAPSTRASGLALVLAVALDVVLAGGLLVPAAAQGRITVANPDGEATVDPTYSTTLTVRGAGFQAVKGGHGGIYVVFGHTRAQWRPSRGGRTGEDYFYVPDSESRDNQGFQQFVAFPGSDTTSSAQATMSTDGSWSVTLTVPGAVFEAFDRRGGSRTIDCRELACGVITVGAHGVTNAHNETFTRVRVADLYAPTDPSPTAAAATEGAAATPSSAAGADPDTGPGADPATGQGEIGPITGEPTSSALEVDRSAATAGHVLPFAASGLVAGRPYSVLLDDGRAGAGPFVAGADGRLAGVLTLPVDLGPGTHVLRLWAGADVDAPAVGFAVALGDGGAAGLAPVTGPRDPWAVALVVAGLLALAAALLRLGLLVRGRRRG